MAYRHETFQLKPGAHVLPAPDGSARLLDLGGKFYSLNPIAARFLEISLSSDPNSELITLVEMRQTAMSEIKPQYHDFIKNLKDSGLLVSGDAQESISGLMLSRALGFVALICRLVLRVIPFAWTPWLILAAARLSFLYLGWHRTVELWSKMFPLARGSNGSLDIASTVDGIHNSVCHSASRHIFRVACKERALACWCLLRSRGLANELVVGSTLFPLTSHAWCEFQGRILSDFADHCDRFIPVARFS